MSDDDRDNDIESDADKRAHHNALERKRRDHIKDSFSMLRDALPYFQGDKVRVFDNMDKTATCQQFTNPTYYELFGLNATEIKKKQKISNRNLEARASRAQILKKAADYITSMRRKNTAHQQDIDDLKRQNKALEEQIRMLEKNRTPDAIASANTAMESAVKTIKNISMSNYNPSEYADSSESEDSSDNSRDSSDSPRKRLKTDPARI